MVRTMSMTKTINMIGATTLHYTVHQSSSIPFINTPLYVTLAELCILHTTAHRDATLIHVDHAMYGIERCRIHTPYGHRNPDRAREEPSCSSTRGGKALVLRDEPLFMDLWTWLFREARGSGVQRPAPLRTRASPSSFTPPLFPPSPLNHARGRSHRRHSGNAAHAERGPTFMCLRRAPSRARLRVAPPGSASSRRLCPAVCRRD